MICKIATITEYGFPTHNGLKVKGNGKHWHSVYRSDSLILADKRKHETKEPFIIAGAIPLRKIKEPNDDQRLLIRVADRIIEEHRNIK